MEWSDLGTSAWLWLGAIGVTGGIVALVVLATVVAFAAKPR